MTKFNVTYVYEGKGENGNRVTVNIGTVENNFDLIRSVISALEVADHTMWTELNSITVTRLNDDESIYYSTKPFPNVTEKAQHTINIDDIPLPRSDN